MANFKVIPQSTWLAKLSTLTASQLIYGDTDGTVTQSSSLAWDATNSTLKLGGAATSANSKLAILASKTVSTVAAATVWKGLDFQASTITLTAGGTAPSRLDLAYIDPPVITQTAGTAYTVAACSALHIAGVPTASAAGGGTPTLSNASAISISASAGYYIYMTASNFWHSNGAAAATEFRVAAWSLNDIGLSTRAAGNIMYLGYNSGYPTNYFPEIGIFGQAAGTTPGTVRIRTGTATARQAETLVIDASGNTIVGAAAAGTTAASCLALSNTATQPSASADLCHLSAADHNAVAGAAALAIYQEAATVTCGDQTVDRAVLATVNGVPLWLMGRSAAPV